MQIFKHENAHNYIRFINIKPSSSDMLKIALQKNLHAVNFEDTNISLFAIL